MEILDLIRKFQKFANKKDVELGIFNKKMQKRTGLLQIISPLNINNITFTRKDYIRLVPCFPSSCLEVLGRNEKKLSLFLRCIEQ